MQKVYDIIIIGGGPAGYTSALYASRAGFSVLVLEGTVVGGQMALTGTIDNYPGFESGIEGFSLAFKMQLGAERFGAQTKYALVTKVNLSEKIKKITTTDGDFYSRAVIISTGASPRALKIEGENQLVGKGLHYCAHCDGRFYKDKTVVVVGGGNSAVSDALYLSNLAKKVYLVHRRDTLRATKVYHDPLLKAKNVQFVWNSKVVEYIADERVKGVKIQNLLSGEISNLNADGVFVSIGREPATQLFKGQLEIDDFGYIVADESTKTNISGVFAVGDVRTKQLRQIVTAVADGAVAAHFAEEFLLVE